MDVARQWYEENRRKWDALAVAWTDTGPPASPSSDDIAHFLTELELLPSCRRAALLGSTPRLRAAMLASFPSLRLDIIDFSPAMYEATTALIPVEYKGREQLVSEEWTSPVRWPEQPYDAILGDKALDNLPIEAWPEFFAQLRERLSPDGALILHVAFPDPTMKGKKFPELYEKWEQRFQKHETKLDTAAAGCWEDLLSASAGEGLSYLSIEAYWPEVLELASPQYIHPLATRIVELFSGSIEGKWSNFTLGDVAAATEPFFLVSSLRTSSDYFGSQWQPIISLRPI